MGPGVCGSRRQKGLLQTGFCLLALLCLGSGVFFYHHLQQKVRSSETLSLKFKQQQEALSAQLQVVYEHRSRLERSLQKERGEHKKTKEDFLVYKLEAQEALNKEKQDAMNRYGALSSQHKILKNQHEDVKKQLLDMQVQHNALKLQNRKTVEGHSQKYSQLQQEKEDQVLSLQDSVSKLREESKLLRKAHQDVHTQLRNAQVQLEEFRQLKEALQRMPSFKELGAARGHQPFQLMAPDKKLFRARGAETQPLRSQDEKGPGAIPPPGTQTDSGSKTAGGGAQPPDGKAKIQGPAIFGPPDLHQQPAPPPRAAQGSDGHFPRFTRNVNSLQAGNGDPKDASSAPGERKETRETPGAAGPQEKPVFGSEQPPYTPDRRVQSWQDIVNKVNARMDEEQEQPPLPRVAMDPRRAHLQLARPRPRTQDRAANQEEENKEVADDEELEMDAGMIDREENPQGLREPIAQEPMMPEDAADPAQDPNNQGEDEFEEAALERPAVAEKAARVDSAKDPKQQVRLEPPRNTKEAGVLDKVGEEAADDYQEDQEQEGDDRGGEVDDNDELQLVQENKSPGDEPRAKDKKDDYY